MSRACWGIGLVVFVITCVLWSTHASGQSDREGGENPAGAPSERSAHTENTDHNAGSQHLGPGPGSAEKQIEAALEKPLNAPLDYEDVPLQDVLSVLMDEYDIPIMFNLAALEELGISPDIEISIKLRNISLRSALNHILQQPGLEELTYVIDDEVLLITTSEKANEKLSVQVYRVDDLLRDSPPVADGNADTSYSSLQRVVTTCVVYDSWIVNGKGEGQCLIMEPGLMVVSQTQRVHEQVNDLLQKIRQARDEIETEAQLSVDTSFGF